MSGEKKIAAELFSCTYNAASGAHAAQRLWSHSLGWVLRGIVVFVIEAIQAALTAKLL